VPVAVGNGSVFSTLDRNRPFAARCGRIGGSNPFSTWGIRKNGSSDLESRPFSRTVSRLCLHKACQELSARSMTLTKRPPGHHIAYVKHNRGPLAGRYALSGVLSPVLPLSLVKRCVNRTATGRSAVGSTASVPGITLWQIYIDPKVASFEQLGPSRVARQGTRQSILAPPRTRLAVRECCACPAALSITATHAALLGSESALHRWPRSREAARRRASGSLLLRGILARQSARAPTRRAAPRCTGRTSA
jgi:hypothetical protein